MENMILNTIKETAVKEVKFVAGVAVGAIGATAVAERKQIAALAKKVMPKKKAKEVIVVDINEEDIEVEEK